MSFDERNPNEQEVQPERDEAKEAKREPLPGITGELAGGCKTVCHKCGAYLDDLEPAGARPSQVKHQDRVSAEETHTEHDGAAS